MSKHIAILLLAYCLMSVAAKAQGRQNSKDDEGIVIDLQGVKLTIPNLVLHDHEGRQVRFYSDLIKDKVVVLSFFYTSCAYTCTMQGRTFAKLQSLLGERLGKSVFLISVTTDPVKDNPMRLKAWAMHYKVEPGWTLVTGEVSEINKLLLPFTGNRAGGGMHLPSTFIGNDKSGVWISATGVFSPENLLQVVNHLTRDDTRKSK